ncbi:hypothetical protein C8R43DRAFT_1141705 [Mycena crocata]|nr:hypothetical protein C8R43DRAFT_1141705 [Mycena crocata]
MHILARICTLSVVFIASLAVPVEVQPVSSPEPMNFVGSPFSRALTPKSTNKSINPTGQEYQRGINISSDPKLTNSLDSFATIDLSSELIAEATKASRQHNPDL